MSKPEQMSKPLWTTWAVEEDCPHLILAKAIGDRLTKANFTCEECGMTPKNLCLQYKESEIDAVIYFMIRYFKWVKESKSNFIVGTIQRINPKLLTIIQRDSDKQVSLPMKPDVYTHILKEQQWDDRYLKRTLLFETDTEKGYVIKIHYLQKLETLIEEDAST